MYLNVAKNYRKSIAFTHDLQPSRRRVPSRLRLGLRRRELVPRRHRRLGVAAARRRRGRATRLVREAAGRLPFAKNGWCRLKLLFG